MGNPNSFFPGREEGLVARESPSGPSFAFSPDGNTIVVEKDTTDLWSHLHVTPFGSPEFTQLTVADTVKRTEVNWNSDGTSIVYLELVGGRESLAIRRTTGVSETRRIELGPFEEMEIYEMIGIPNATILQTVTSNVARWLKKDDFGTVEPGKRADLILVDGDPLVRVRDLENVVLVVQGGRVRDRFIKCVTRVYLKHPPKP